MAENRPSSRRRSCRQCGLTTTELGLVLAVTVVMTAVSVPVALNTIRTYRRDAAAQHVLWQIRTAQSLAASRNTVVGFQWGPDAGRPADSFRIVRDATGSCSLPLAVAAEDGTNVIQGWSSLGADYAGVTIQSVKDASDTTVGGVMFNPIGASVNTCATVAFPLRITLIDGAGRERAITVASAGDTRLR